MLDDVIAAALPSQPAGLTWFYPGLDPGSEPRSTDILQRCRPSALDDWKRWWPQTGREPTWDGFAATNADGAEEWLLVEAKANHPEFVGAPCMARSTESRRRIERSLGQVRRSLGVHRYFSWTGSYYQYANRLGFLRFLVERDVQARLVLIYFVGDAFPDDTPCPQSADEWRALIEARRLTLGLPSSHVLSDRVHHVFLDPFGEPDPHPEARTARTGSAANEPR